MQVFVKFLTKKKVIFFVLRANVKKIRNWEKVPIYRFPHKAWGVYYGPPCMFIYYIYTSDRHIFFLFSADYNKINGQQL